MPASPAIDLQQISHSLGLQQSRVAAVVGLLDAGNTVPFITRYRKDQTGGLDEEQIRHIQERVVRQRLHADRKQTILRSIESQGKLTPELAAAIEAAETIKRLEDLYLPYKPKKQTLATQARVRGLEPLALEILAADAAANDLDARAADFVNTDKQVATPADALLGAGHILAEMFAERADVRGKLRSILEHTGKIVTVAGEVESKKASEPAPEPEAVVEESAPEMVASEAIAVEEVATEESVVEESTPDEAVSEPISAEETADEQPPETIASEAPSAESTEATPAAEAAPAVASSAATKKTKPNTKAARKDKKEQARKEKEAKIQRTSATTSSTARR